MAYIGVQPTAGQYRKLDNISSGFNGSTTSFTTSVGGTNVTAGTAQQLIVSLGGVIQQPDSDYSVSTNTITFTTAPAAGLDFFAILMGDALNTVTPSDGSVTTSKLAGSLSVGLTAGSASTPALFFTGDTNTGVYSPGADQIAVTTGGTARLTIDSSGNFNIDSNTLYVDAANNRVGIGNSSPAGLLHLSSTFGTTLTTGFRIDGTGTTTNNVAPISFYTQSSNWGTQHAANIACGNLSGTDGGGYLRFSTSPDGNTAPSERLRITAAGLVGIGTTNPGSYSAQLAISGGRLAVVYTASGIELDPQFGFVAGTVRAYDRITTSYKTLGLTGDAVAFGINDVEKARIDSSGRLLVGTSSTSDNATVVLEGSSSGAGNPAILYLRRNEATPGSGGNLGQINFSDNTGGSGICARINAIRDGGTWSGASKPGALLFSTTADGASSPTERMRIGNDGTTYFGVTGAPSGSVGGSAFLAESDSRRTLYMASTTTAGTTLQVFRNPNGQVGSITTSGSATAFNTSSDYRLKENVSAVTDGITRLQQLKPSRFNFKVEPGKTVDGFIAHEVQAVVPEAIHGTKDAVDADGNPIYQGIDQSKLVPLLTAALQEAVAKIESLEARLTAAGI